MSIQSFFSKTYKNNSKKPGTINGNKAFFDLSRFAVFAVNTRFEKVQFFIADCEQIDLVTNKPKIVFQGCKETAKKRIQSFMDIN
tara:strand:- start:65 stop:319 length:255 start_codon:yes stop_codon:yes gene_type:complete